MIVVGADTETTGLDPKKGHRIVEFAFALYDIDTKKKIGQFVKRINPKRKIPLEAQKVHGITDEDVKHEHEFGFYAPQIAKILEKADVLVAHNAAFDVSFLVHHLREENVDIPDIQVIDTADARWATSSGKTPKLQELCFACGVEYDQDKAHSAIYDVEVMMECFFSARRDGFFEIEGYDAIPF